MGWQQLSPDDVRDLLRTATSDSVVEWSEAHGFSKAWIYRILNGDAEPSKKICTTLGISREATYWIKE